MIVGRLLGMQYRVYKTTDIEKLARAMSEAWERYMKRGKNK